MDHMAQKTAKPKKSVARFVFRDKDGWLRRAADNIRSLRTQKGLTKDELARAVGYGSENTVTNWEAGPDAQKSTAQFAGPEALIAMRELFGRSIEWLLGKENAPAYAVDSMQLSKGVTLTDADLEEALLIRLRQMVESRMQTDGVGAALIRESVARNGMELAIRPAAPLRVSALEHLMDRVEGMARGAAYASARERLELRVAQERPPELAAAVRLGADLVISDMEFARAKDPSAFALREHQRETAWRQYDDAVAAHAPVRRTKPPHRRKPARR